jgi:hypothetical protein
VTGRKIQSRYFSNPYGYKKIKGGGGGGRGNFVIPDGNRGIEKGLVYPDTAFYGRMFGFTSLQRMCHLLCINVQLNVWKMV